MYLPRGHEPREARAHEGHERPRSGTRQGKSMQRVGAKCPCACLATVEALEVRQANENEQRCNTHAIWA